MNEVYVRIVTALVRPCAHACVKYALIHAMRTFMCVIFGCVYVMYVCNTFMPVLHPCMFACMYVCML